MTSRKYERKKMSQWQHTSAELHPNANTYCFAFTYFFTKKIPTIFANTKRPTYCSVEHRADSHMKKLPSEVCVKKKKRSVCETLICVIEFMQGSLHIGMQVCECGLGDIPFWLITHFAPAFPTQCLRHFLPWAGTEIDGILELSKEKLCPFALSVCE